MTMLQLRDLMYTALAVSCVGCLMCYAAFELHPHTAETRAGDLRLLCVWLACAVVFCIVDEMRKAYETRPAAGLRGWLWRCMVALEILRKGDEAVAAWCEDGEA